MTYTLFQQMGSNQKLNNEREENVNIFIYGITITFFSVEKV